MIAVSRSLRDLLVLNHLISPAKVVVVGNGSSNGVVIPETAQLPDPDAVRGAVIGFVGRANADKGFDLLAATITELAGRGLRGELLIVGDDEDGSRNEHIEHVRATGWNVTWPGQCG